MKNISLILVSLLAFSCNQDCTCTIIGSYKANGVWVDYSKSNFVVNDCDDVIQGANYEQSGSGYQIKVVTRCE